MKILILLTLLLLTNVSFAGPGYASGAGGGGGGGLTQLISTADDVTMVDNYQYVAACPTATCNGGDKQTFTLPSSPAVGTTIQILGHPDNEQGWELYTNASAASQVLYRGDYGTDPSSSSAVRVGSSIEQYGSAILTCIAGGTNAKWVATSEEDSTISSGIAYDSGISAHWTLDEATGTFADSRASYDLTRMSAVGSTIGKFEQAADNFSSSTNYIRGYYAALALTGPQANLQGTFEVWVKFNNLVPSYQSIMVNGNGYSNANYTLALYVNGTTLTFGANGIALLSTSVSGYDDGAWHYIVAVLDNQSATKKTIIYIDGSEATSENTSKDATNALGYITIGGSSSANNEFEGAIDDAVLWVDDVMSAAEVTARWNLGIGKRYY